MSGLPVSTRGLAVGWDGRTVVADIDLGVPAATTLAIVGTNGSGKSTLLRTLVGLQPALAGTVSVLDGAPGTQPDRVAYVGQFHPQGFVLPLRVRDVVAMGRFPRLGLLRRPGGEDRDMVEQAMVRMGIADLARRALRDLSGGQRQRAYVAQALAQHADLLLLDEPASGLDPAARELLTAALAQERARGATVIHSTHDVREAMAADLAMLLAGRVVSVGPPAQAVSREAVIATFGLILGDLPDGTPIALDPGHAHGHHDPQGHSEMCH